ISGAVEITERVLREVLVPRPAVVTLDVDTPVAEARVQLAASGHSRAPVVRNGNLDDTVGVVALRDLMSDDVDIAKVARPPYMFPDSLRVADALRRFKADREQFALVVDEHGAVDGIVTLEDLVEEIVGEIYDHTDRDVAAARHEPDGSIVVVGTFPVHDLPDLGVDVGEFANGDYTTVAGLVIARLGRLPTRPGDVVAINGWTAEVAAVERRAVTSVRLRPTTTADRRDGQRRGDDKRTTAR